MIGMGLIAIGVLVLTVIVMAGMRRWSLAEESAEKRLERPGSHPLTYVVPAGQDSALLVAALHHEGLTALTEFREGRELLLVECPEPGDRRRVRDVIQQVEGGPEAPLHIASVSFEDER